MARWISRNKKVVLMGLYWQAEEDKRWLEAHKLAKYAEANLMKDVEGWKMHTKVYNSGRWMPPTRPVGIFEQ